MKNCITFLLILLLIVPPLQAHTDIVIENVSSELHIDSSIENSHQDEHHKNDSKEEKETEHHHHCSVVSSSTIFIKEETSIGFFNIFIHKEKPDFYKNLYASNFLESLFQPPKFS